MKQKKHRWIKWAVLGAVVAAVLLVLFLRPREAAYDEETAKSQTLSTYLSFTGTVEAKERQVLTATTATQIKTVAVKEGDSVKEGDTLFETITGQKLTAEMDGEVGPIAIEEGDVVMAGTQLATVTDYSALQVGIKVDEYDVVSLEEGKEVTLKLGALGKEAKGTVAHVSKEAATVSGISYFPATIEIEEVEGLRAGMSAEVTLLKEQAEDAVTLSMKAIQFDNENKPYVYYRDEKGKVQTKAVAVGLQDGVTVQVTEGVAAGETILLPKETMDLMTMHKNGGNRGSGRLVAVPRKILTMEGITKAYRMGEEEQLVLDGIDFTVEEGEFVSILGPSGSGKSTMMNILGCLDTPTGGRYTLAGEDVSRLDEAALSHIRAKEVGFIFQSFQLLPRLSVLENVELPMIYAGVPVRERRRRAQEMLERVGLSEKLRHRPNQLSGGQQQRVAIARAISTDPTILLADEPTGALDQKTGRQVMELFTQLNREGRTIVMITHDTHIAGYAGRIVRLLDGRLTEGGVEDA